MTMNILLSILLPLVFAAGSAFYCARELPRRTGVPEEDGLSGQVLSGSAEKVFPKTGETLCWRGMTLDRQGLLLAGGLCLVAGGGCFALGLIYYNNTVEYGLKLLFCFDLLVAAALIDCRSKTIPNRLILAGLAGAAAFLAVECLLGFTPLALVRESLLGLTMGGGVFLLCNLLTRGGIGMGDVKLFGILGLMLGWTGVFDLIFVSVVLVAAYGVLLLLRRRLDRKTQVPVGPFALAGMAVIMLLGV